MVGASNAPAPQDTSQEQRGSARTATQAEQEAPSIVPPAARSSEERGRRADLAVSLQLR